ncbi:MAG: ABC transporter permease [Eubacteriales bacterium]|nr:ABC transporter permease [Eubacteriales bacterium]
MTLLIGSLELGLLYGIMVMGIYLSFRILNVPDLTAEGSFTLGLAASAVATASGHPAAGLFLAALAGGMAGLVTGFLQTRLLIHPVLAGILTMSGLYSVNMFVLGGTPNLTLLGKTTLFGAVQAAFPGMDKEAARLLVSGLFSLCCAGLMSVFFKTRLGLCIRATGDNEAMVRASSINVSATKMTALAISNALIALCGGIIAQYQSFADINSGVGILVVGLASVIIGEALFGRRSVTRGFFSAIAGSVIYRYIIALATKTNFFPAYMLRLLSAVIVGIALALPALRLLREQGALRRKHAA